MFLVLEHIAVNIGNIRDDRRRVIPDLSKSRIGNRTNIANRKAFNLFGSGQRYLSDVDTATAEAAFAVHQIVAP